MIPPDGAIWKAFSPEELTETEAIARRRNKSKHPHYRKDRRVSGMSNMRMNVISVRGEYAVGSELLDLPVSDKTGMGGVLWQFEYCDIPIQVKTMQRRLLVKEKEDFRASLVVLCHYFEGMDDIRITAWIDQSTFLAKHVRDDIGYGLTCIMEPKDMRPIPELVSILARRKKEVEQGGE